MHNETPTNPATAPVNFPPGYEEKARLYAFEGEKAEQTPLPGPLPQAFAPEEVRLPAEIEALGFKLRDPVMTDWATLVAIASPIVDELREFAKPPEERAHMPYSDEEFWELFYVFTRPAAESRAVLREGRDTFRERAMAGTASRISLGEGMTHKPAIMTALATNIVRSLLTVQQYRVADGDKQTGFTQPPADRATASAGGWKSSAG